jgi:signal transduction histidine kinase
MELSKERLLNETYVRFMEIGLNSPEDLGDLDELVSPDLMGFGTTVDERMFSIADLKGLLDRQRVQSEGLSVKWSLHPVFRKVMKDENSALFVDDVHLLVTVNEETIQIDLRFSLVFEFINYKWMIIHFHGSKAEQVSTEEDTWGIDIWKKRSEELEMLVKERTEELEKSIEKLKSTQAQLIQSEKLASLGELTAGIAHEIQNPLNFVNNFSELSVELAKELDEEVDKEVMDKGLVKELVMDLSQNQEKINFHGKRASSIVKGMLEHSRTSTGVKELTDINQLADEYLRLAYHGLRAKNHSFHSDYHTEFDKNLPKIEVVPQDIGRVLLNLINNAFWAVSTVEKPMVVVKTEQIDSHVVIKVIDNGTGMSEEVKAKIFQPFFTTKPTGQGTGLGLSLSYDIVKAHGGELKVNSSKSSVNEKPQVGSEFVITLSIV